MSGKDKNAGFRKFEDEGAKRSAEENLGSSRVPVLFVAVGVGIPLLVLVAVLSSSGSPSPSGVPAFGKEMRDEWYVLEEDVVFVNHGSYGAVPLPLRQNETAIRLRAESNPDRWFRTELYPAEERVRAVIAEYIHADVKDVVLVEDASVAVNAVLRSLDFSPADTILDLNFAYGMVKETIQFVVKRFGASVRTVQLPLPLTNAIVLSLVTEAFEDAKAEGKPITFAVFDHITSTPAVILPIADMVSIAHSYDCPVLVDGAHAVGQVPLQMDAIAADWYLSNVHKWLSGARGSAFLYVAPDKHPLTHPTVISFGYNKGLDQEFQWTGTRDWSAMLAVAAAVDLRNSLGDENVRSYNDNMCACVETNLKKRWAVESPLEAGMTASLFNVEIPCDQPAPSCYSWSLDTAMLDFYDKKRVWVPFLQVDSKRYLRISCQVYNEADDYTQLVLRYEAWSGLKPADASAVFSAC